MKKTATRHTIIFHEKDKKKGKFVAGLYTRAIERQFEYRYPFLSYIYFWYAVTRVLFLRNSLLLL